MLQGVIRGILECTTAVAKNMKNQPLSHPSIICVLAASVAFMFDLAMPLGVAGGIPYIVLVLIGTWLPGTKPVIGLAMLGSVLTLAGLYLSPSGGTMWVVLTNRSLAIFSIWIMAWLIVNRKHAEQAKQRSEERNHLLLSAVGDGIYGVDLTGIISFTNPAACTLLGYTEAELLGQPCHQLIHHSHPDGSPYPLKDCPMYAAIQDGNQRQELEEILWCKNGSQLPIEFTCAPILHAGKLDGAVIIFRDITERQRTAAILKDQEARIHAIFEYNPEAILTIDDTSIIDHVNPAAVHMFGYSIEELLGRNIAMLLPEQMRATHDDYVRNSDSSRGTDLQPTPRARRPT